jgi:hypothetical protein
VEFFCSKGDDGEAALGFYVIICATKGIGSVLENGGGKGGRGGGKKGGKREGEEKKEGGEERF